MFVSVRVCVYVSVQYLCHRLGEYKTIGERGEGDEDEEGRDEDAMGNDENPCMDVDDDADYGSSSSSSSSNRNKRGMKSTGSLSSIQCRGGSSSSAREEEEVEVVDSPFVYPNTLSIAGSHNLNTPS